MMILVVIRSDKKDLSYHVQHCQILREQRQKEPFAYKLTDIINAKMGGYEPCPVCNPDDIKHRLDLLAQVTKNSANISTYSNQKRKNIRKQAKQVSLQKTNSSNEVNDSLFDKKYIGMVKEKYLMTSKWSWPAGVVYILDKNSKQEKDILEYIYSSYPEVKHKKQIKRAILSLDNDKFWGAWAELRIYDWLTYKGMKLEPEFALGKGRPDYLTKYVKNKSHDELIIEVTSVNAESAISRKEDNRIRQMFAHLDKIASEYKYVFWCHIPSYYLPFPYKIDYTSLQHSFESQMKINKSQVDKHHTFICKNNEVAIQIRILYESKSDKGYIRGYSLGFTDDKEELEKFTKRIYDRIQEKINKYKEDLIKVRKPYVVALFVKGPFLLGSFEESLKKVLKFEELRSVVNDSKLSGILLYETFTFHERDSSYVIDPIETLYCNPNALYPVDDDFKTLLNK